MGINSIKIEGGYYIKARKIKNSDIGHAPPHIREIWDYLLREANHSGKKKHGEVLERGQILTTYNEILEDLHWMVGWRKQKYSKAQCETAMKFLRTHRRNGPMITTKKTTRGMIITILKYDYYQNPKNYENHRGDHKESHGETRGVPQQHDTIDKNGKNGKKENKKHSSSADEVGIDGVDFLRTKKGRILKGKRWESFKLFWEAFDYKRGKREAADSWHDIQKLTGALVEEICVAAKKEAERRASLKSAGKTPKMAQGWISSYRWEDEIDDIEVKKKPWHV